MIELVEKDIKLSIKILPIFKKVEEIINIRREREDIKKDSNGTFRDEIYNT